MRSAIGVLVGFLLLASPALGRGIEAGEWALSDGLPQVRDGRLSLPVPNAISATLTTRELRELSFGFGGGCELSAEVSIDGRAVKSFAVPNDESRREVAVRANPGDHLVRIELTPGGRCERGRAVLESSSMREWVPIGTEIGWTYLSGDRPYQELVADHVDSVTDGNDMMWNEVEPQQGVFDFTAADRAIGFAEENGLEARGHPLVWRHFLPAWLRNHNWTRDEAIEILRNHVQTVVGHFRGRVTEWDVVNEPIGTNGGLRQNFFMEEIGRDYIGLAFLFAHEADPAAKLYMNDYLVEEENRKSDSFLAVARELVRLEIPFDGVGFQFHVGTDGWVDTPDAAANFERFSELGLEIQISEMDVPDRTANPGTPTTAASARRTRSRRRPGPAAASRPAPGSRPGG